MRAVSLKELGEFGLIGRLNAGLQRRAGVKVGIGDDAAVLESMHQPVVTVDALVEGVHFRRDWMSAEALGRKSMAVNVSDVAAMGARPVAAFVTLVVPSEESLEFIEGIYRGMETCARKFDFTIAGGDTVRTSGPCVLSITVVGEVLNSGRGSILRSGAQAGDVLLVSGTLGDAAAGLELLLHPESRLEASIREYLLDRHLNPTPRLAEIRALLTKLPETVHGALDLSDGLAGDARHMALQSGMRIEVEVESLPISAACRAVADWIGADVVDWALSGGEDYELLLAVHPEQMPAVIDCVLTQTGTQLTPIGRCVEGPPEVVVMESGEVRPQKTGFTHF